VCKGYKNGIIMLTYIIDQKTFYLVSWFHRTMILRSPEFCSIINLNQIVTETHLWLKILNHVIKELSSNGILRVSLLCC